MPRRYKKRLPEHSFYQDLGSALRNARTVAGKSQGDIAEFLDLSFQQVQKYERGANRIPVDHLVNLANYLEVPLSQLIAPSRADDVFQTLAEQFSAPEFRALMEAWGAIKDRSVRTALLNLVRCMAALKG